MSTTTSEVIETAMAKRSTTVISIYKIKRLYYTTEEDFTM